MLIKKIIFCFGVIFVYLLMITIPSGLSSEPSEAEKHEYKQDIVRIESWSKSLKPGFTNDLKEYENSINEIQSKWSKKKKEYYARLMWEVCKPLSSGRFSDERQYDVARRYALSALVEPNEIPLEIELELIGHVMTDTVTPRAPKGQEWANRRKKDVEVRFHAWKRLIDAIDPNWDPNQELWSPNAVAVSMGFPGTIEPKSIKDPNLRAEYEAAIEINNLKIKRYTEQSRLHKWLERFPKRAEEYIIQAYSKPPFDVEELKQYLDKYIVNTKTKARILDGVTKNMEKETRKESTTP
jgi:hypothetical protein